jgi:hypothetical protein
MNRKGWQRFTRDLSKATLRERQNDMEEYLKVSEVIDWQHPKVVEQAQQIAAGYETSIAIAKACFEWVRDEIYHSFDYQMNPVTCRASDVLKYKTGYCYAKSHLLAALLRANQIPAGFCYQRLSIDDKGAPYSLHGVNAIYLAEIGWYRVDARGNKAGVNAQFSPPQERLAFKTQFPEEADFQSILAEPLQIVVEALQTQNTWDGMLDNLPDLSVESAKHYGLNDITGFESAYQIRVARVEELPLLSHIERSAAGLFLDTPYSFLVNADPLPLDFVQQRFQAGQVWVAGFLSPFGDPTLLTILRARVCVPRVGDRVYFHQKLPRTGSCRAG